MDEYDLAGNVSGFCEVGGSAAANVDNRDMLRRSKRGRPSHRHCMRAENRGQQSAHLCIAHFIERSHRHLGRALGPGVRNREAFGMNAVSPGNGKGFYSPLDRMLHGGRAGHAAADFVGQLAQVAFERGGLQGGLNDAGRVFGLSGRIERKRGGAEDEAQAQDF